jgi:predicted  nucleic acid-binding Zn-ribbon protein
LWGEGIQPIFIGRGAKCRLPERLMDTDNLILEHLRAIRGNVERLVEDMREVKGRLGILESQYASLSNRLDRMDERVARIEKRLELHDA